ncbi:MAG: phenylalanine--tRNA ligase subunit alpha [Acidimicrobiales bacterium]
MDPGALGAVVGSAAQEAAVCTSLEALRELETRLVGKRGELAVARGALGSLAPEERRSVGALVQQVWRDVEAVLESRARELADSERAARLASERQDLTELVHVAERGRLHIVTRTRRELEDVFIGMGFAIAEGPEAETDWYNFEALNMPHAHPARSMWDTLYLDIGDPESVVLRTHTSPVQIRLMQQQGPPIYAVMPGRCYRRDTPDMRHIPIFHQIEGLVVDEGITFADLAGTIEIFTTAYFGTDIHARLRPSYFPFTEPSAEFEITCTICKGSGCRTCSQTGWVELGGAGMVDPAVFEAVGVDSERYTGFAFGFGIDRCAQMRHEIPDMRALLENDVRFLTRI